MRQAMKVYLITYGPMSSCVLLPATEVQAFLKTIPIEERRCALITATDLTEDDIEFVARTQEIIKRHETEITEARMNLADRLARKRGA